MGNKIAIILPYFGRFKPSASLFFSSCNRNPDIDWLVFTDCEKPVPLGANVHWNMTTLDSIRQLAEEKLKMPVRMDRPYKLCDLKAFYGIVFEDYLKSYSYWGFGDADVIVGRLMPFLQKINYTSYDKINWMGHLCLIRNEESCSRIILRSVPGVPDADAVLSSEENIGIDERGYNLKFLDAKKAIYTGKLAADIDTFYWRMRCVDWKTLRLLLGTKHVRCTEKNYNMQIFAVLDGITYRVYLKNSKVRLDEFAYIHFRKEVPIHIEADCMNFLLTRDGFIPIEGGRSSMNDYDTVRRYILQYNRQEDRLHEIYGFFVNYYRKVSGKRGW